MQEIIRFTTNHQILSIVWICLLISLVYTTFIKFISNIKDITSSEATRLINKEGAVVVDLRQHNDFCKGHIIGAINLPRSDIKAHNFKELNKYKNQPIIVVDSTGLKTQKPANVLSEAGFSKVFILKEGIFGWNEENRPLIRSK